MHGKTGKVQLMLNRIASFFKTLKTCAEQLTDEQRWYRILSKAVEKYIHGTLLRPKNCLPMPVS